MADASGLVTAIRRAFDRYEVADDVQLARYVQDNNDGTHRVTIYNPDGSEGPEVDAYGDVKPWPGALVRISTDRKRYGPDKWAIMGADTDSYIVSGIKPPDMSVGNHGATHGFNQSDEANTLHPFQFYPLRTNPYSTMTIRTWLGLYGPLDGAYRRLTSYIDTDLTANRPANNKRYVTLSLDSAGNLTATNGAIQAVLTAEDIPLPPAGEWAIAAVWIRSTDTEITRGQIEDLRWQTQWRNEYTPRTGWTPDAQTEVTMSWNDGTRTLTLTPVGASYTYWIEGTQYVKTAAESVTINDTEGLWYIHYLGDTLTATQVLWDYADTDKALVAFLYWDATNNLAIGGKPRWELHSWLMDTKTHAWAHNTIGTRYESGLAVSENPANQLEVGNGTIWDEDNEIAITDGAGAGLFEQPLSPLQAYKLYKSGAGGDWRHGGAFGTTPVVLDGANDVYWNEFAGGVWGLTAAGANQYCAYWVVATPDIDNPVEIIMGQGSPDSNIDDARENNPLEDLDLSAVGPEFKVLARVMVRNVGGAPFYEVSEIDDYRTADLVPATSVIKDHGALAGRADDIKSHSALYPLYADGVTKTVGAAGDFTTIQAAIDWFADREVIYGDCIIDVDAAAYDEAVDFSGLVIAAGDSLTLQGDTRVLAGLSYVSCNANAAAWTALTVYGAGAEVRPVAGNNGFFYYTVAGGTSAAGEPVWPVVIGNTVVDGTVTWICTGVLMNRASLANGGGGSCQITSAGNVITVTGTTANPDFDADGWVNGDKILTFNNAGAIAEYTISATLNNTITLTVAAPAMGNDSTAICLLPNRRIERTAAGPCVSVDTVRGIVIDGFYLESSTGALCHGLSVINGGACEAVRVATYVEDYGFNAEDLSFIDAARGAISAWGAAAAARGYYCIRSSLVKAQYSVAVYGQHLYRCFDFSEMSCPDSTAVEGTGYAYSSALFSDINAARGIARQSGTGYRADFMSLGYAATTSTYDYGNTTDYNPAPALPGSAQGNHFAVIYAS